MGLEDEAWRKAEEIHRQNTQRAAAWILTRQARQARGNWDAENYSNWPNCSNYSKQMRRLHLSSHGSLRNWRGV